MIKAFTGGKEVELTPLSRKNSRAKTSPEVASIESSRKNDGLPTDRIIDCSCRRSVRTTANVARVEERICSYSMASVKVLDDHQYFRYLI